MCSKIRAFPRFRPFATPVPLDLIAGFFPCSAPDRHGGRCPVIIGTTKGVQPSVNQCDPSLRAGKTQGPASTIKSGPGEVRLIDETGQNVGVIAKIDAVARAEAAGLDLVEISPDAEPPVCKILDFGKFKFQEQKKAAEARKNQKIVELKEIKMRPGIDDHDYDVKMRAIKRFFDEGDKVKITLRFRGREMAHSQLGMAVLQRVKADTEAISKVESEPRFEGRQMVMVLAPK